ncbi:MAG TPA: gluconate 2-dehydrogenase subunit 3 family protein, partial [Candidatus Binataceae bacterium]
MKIALSRRQFLWTASAGVLAAGLPAVAWRRWQVSEARADSRPRYFTDPGDYATLQDVVDLIIPPDTDFTGQPSPGAKAAGVADYIDFLLGAFLSSAPFIFAGGPFSDRNPVGGQGLTDDMAQPIVLTPLQRLAWRIRILGTAGAATNATDAARIKIVKANNILAGVGDGFGDVPGFQQQYSAGIFALRKNARSMFGKNKDFFDLTTVQQQSLFKAAATTDPDFVALVT